MKEGTMGTAALAVGIPLLLLGGVVLVFGDGLRRWYSGIFFLLMGTLALINGRRWRRDAGGNVPHQASAGKGDGADPGPAE